MQTGPDLIRDIDAFLSMHHGRQVAPLLTPAQCVNADLILGTHDHIDHIDRPSWPGMAQASPQALFVVPELLRMRVVVPAHGERAML